MFYYFRPPDQAVTFCHMLMGNQPSILFAFRVLRDGCSEARQKIKIMAKNILVTPGSELVVWLAMCPLLKRAGEMIQPVGNGQLSSLPRCKTPQPL